MPQGLSAHRPTAYPARPGRRPTQRRPAACLSTRNRASNKAPGPARPSQPAQYGAARTAAARRTAGGSRTRTAAQPAAPRAHRPPPAGQFHDSPKLAIRCEPTNRRPAPSGTPYPARSGPLDARATLAMPQLLWQDTGRGRSRGPGEQGASTWWQHSAQCLWRDGNASRSLAQDTGHRHLAPERTEAVSSARSWRTPQPVTCGSPGRAGQTGCEPSRSIWRIRRLLPMARPRRRMR
jgi:hypothetical protein